MQGIFIYVGIQPNTDWLTGGGGPGSPRFYSHQSDDGHVIPGIFAAGDVRQKLVRQISTAVGDAATAVLAAEEIPGVLMKNSTFIFWRKYGLIWIGGLFFFSYRPVGCGWFSSSTKEEPEQSAGCLDPGGSGCLPAEKI